MFYAVVFNTTKRSEIFTSWEACEKKIYGRNVSHKKFKRLDDAKDFIQSILKPEETSSPQERKVSLLGREYQIKITCEGPILTGYIVHENGQFYFAWDKSRHELPWIKGHGDTKWREHAKKILVEGGIL